MNLWEGQDPPRLARVAREPWVNEECHLRFEAGLVVAVAAEVAQGEGRGQGASG